MAVLSGRDVIRILEANGFVAQKRRGTSHIVMKRTTASGSTTVPVPDHPTLKPGTLSGIIRQSGLARELFEYQ
jgi:predicted RNA binding protein YcfA (HicA-like mRNA interferase family)